MAASLNEIYKMLGELTGTVKAINEKVDVLSREMSDAEDRSEKSRANVHRRLDELVVRTTHIETDVLSAKGRLDAVERATVDMKAVTDDVKIMRERAFGAGTLGVWLWRIGGGILSAAGGFAAAYTWLTGRPPP